MYLLSGFYRISVIALLGIACAAQASMTDLRVDVEGIRPSQPLPRDQALCVPAQDGKSSAGKNIRPAISWSGAPEGTKSFAVFMMDPDVPVDFRDAGKEGKTIAADAARQDFFHYGVIDIPAHVKKLAGGNAGVPPEYGTQLVNDLGGYIATPVQFGGPCPPWNDARIHHYHFIVLALDTEAAAFSAASPVGAVTAKAMFSRMVASSHLLARGSVVATYTLNVDKLNAAARP